MPDLDTIEKLQAMGFIFSGLASLIFWIALGKDLEYFLAVIIFGGVGLTCLIVGFLGSDQAVAKIWGTK